MNLSRRWGRAGAGLAGAAVAIRVLTLNVGPGVRALDAVMVALALCVGGVMLRVPSRWAGSEALIAASGAIALAVLTAVALIAAGGGLPDYTLIAAVAFGALLVGLDSAGPPAVQVALPGAILAAFVVTWLAGAPRSSGIVSLVVAAAGLAAIRVLAVAGAERVRTRVDTETRRGHVYASLGRRIGAARDVFSVASAVLEACRETFPQASTGTILLHDPADGLLKSPGVFLSPGGLVAGGPSYELATGEGLGGAVFASGRTGVWPTTLSASMTQASLRDANRIRLRQSKLGFIRSAIGAPLRVEGTVIGVVLLTSDRREQAWTGADAPLMESLADEAARALERARRMEEEMGQALLDPITSLATRRQVLVVIDRELARASRAEGTLALIVADLDDFGALNTESGHETGNRVLGAFADVLRSILRREDSAARYGGDEFVCVLPGADREQARIVAARIQERFAAATSGDATAGGTVVSASSGIAVYPADAQDVDGLLSVASTELEAAKRTHELTGRSRLRRPVGDVTPT